MKTTGLGYIFDGRYDCKGEVGLMERYNYLKNGNMQQIDLTFGVDTTGKPLIPSYAELSMGFRPLSDKVETDIRVDIEKFVKSNKAYFSYLPSIALIVNGRFTFNYETGEFVPAKSDIRLYLPKIIRTDLGVTNTKGGSEPGILCEVVVRNGIGINSISIDEKVYDSYMANILKHISGVNTKDRVSYLVSRLL